MREYFAGYLPLVTAAPVSLAVPAATDQINVPARSLIQLESLKQPEGGSGTSKRRDARHRRTPHYRKNVAAGGNIMSRPPVSSPVRMLG
jgi:hypothetical protein